MSTITLDFRYAYNQGERRTADPTAYQWDKGHTLDIIVPTAVQSAELHYHKSGDDKAKPFAPNSIEGNTVHANIPNSLFEDSRDIIVYLVVTDDEMYRTEYEGVIDIRARPKPYDYTEDNPENGAQTISGLYGEAKEAIAKAGEAKTSAAEAKTSETNAKTSEGNAKMYASNASDSANTASNKASQAGIYATNASDSATSASESAASIKASADQIAANKKALQTPTTVTDPTSKTVLLAGSQGIDYSKLADAIIAKYQGQTLAGKAQSVKSALDTVRSVQDQTIKTEDSSTPCSYSAGDFFVYDGKLYKASADFSSVTLTADNISTYAEAQTQSALNALNGTLNSSKSKTFTTVYNSTYVSQESITVSKSIRVVVVDILFTTSRTIPKSYEIKIADSSYPAAYAATGIVHGLGSQTPMLVNIDGGKAKITAIATNSTGAVADTYVGSLVYISK